MTPEERLNQAESTAKKAIEEVAEVRRMLEKAGSWVPRYSEKFFYVFHDGARWGVTSVSYFNKNKAQCESFIAAGNCYRTEQEAEEVATQRNFMTECLSAGDLAPNESGYMVWLNRRHNVIRTDWSYGWCPQRRFSKETHAVAWVEKWGGESAVVARLQKGWV